MTFTIGHVPKGVGGVHSWTTQTDEQRRRHVTLPTLETKRKLDEEIFGDKADAEASGRDADRGANQAVDGERGHPDDMRGAGAAADRRDGGRGDCSIATADGGDAGNAAASLDIHQIAARASRLFRADTEG